MPIIPEIVGEDFKPFFTDQLSNEEYHADKSAVSSTWLKEILKSPFSFANMRSKETPAMKFGTTFHLALLEPEEFNRRFIIEPHFEGTGSRTAKKTWLGSHPEGTLWLKEAKYDSLLGMIESVKRHPQAMSILKGSKAEVTGYFRDPVTGIKCRLRADFFNENLMILGDVKTTTDCSHQAFSRVIYDRQYYMQIYYYSLGMQQITGKKVEYPLFLAVESEYPYECALFMPDDAMMDKGRQDYENAMDKLSYCIKNDSWLPFSSEIQSISLPFWALK